MEHPSLGKFPPTLQRLGDTQKLSNTFASRFSSRSKSLIRSRKLGTRLLIKSTFGRWDAVGRQTVAGAICELSKKQIRQKSTNTATCWQPQSSIYDFVNYTGNI